MIKKIKLITVWLLPVIVIGGLINPLLGYLVVAMMGFFLPFSYFKSRYWCWNLCPRGAFLDIVISRVSINKPVPRIFTKQWFRWTVFAVMMGFVSLRLILTGGNPALIGSVFVVMCGVTTILSIIIGMSTKHRGWCTICPMGTLQERLGKVGRPKNTSSG
ncbi:MAG: 4Fe-4S binding protein [Candidatus Omnitrophota bacterium]